MTPVEITGWVVMFGVAVAAFVTLETIHPAEPPKKEEPAKPLEPHQGPPPIVHHQ